MVSSIMWEALKREGSLGESWLYSDVLYKFDLTLLQAVEAIWNWVQLLLLQYFRTPFAE